MLEYSIIPSMINAQEIKFFNEKSYEVKICNPTDSNYLSPYECPHLIIDTFAEKTTKEIKVMYIEIEELKKLGYGINSMRVRKGWFRNQRVIYRLENISNRIPGSKRLNYLPNYHKIQKDILNKRIRLVGPNAGYPHYESQFGGAGPWYGIDSGLPQQPKISLTRESLKFTHKQISNNQLILFYLI